MESSLSRLYAIKKSTTPEQFDQLVKLLEPHPVVARQIHLVGMKREKAYKVWKAITLKLNSLGPPFRKPTEWRKIWTDLRGRTKKKILGSIMQSRDNNYEHVNYNLSSLERCVDRIVRISDTIIADKLKRKEMSRMIKDRSPSMTPKSEYEQRDEYYSENEDDNESCSSTLDDYMPPAPASVKRKRGRPKKIMPKEVSDSPVDAELSPSRDSPKVEDDDDDPTYSPDRMKSRSRRSKNNISNIEYTERRARDNNFSNIEYTERRSRDNNASNIENTKSRRSDINVSKIKDNECRTSDINVSNIENSELRGDRKGRREKQNIEILQEQIELQKKFIKLTEQQTAIAHRQAEAIEKLVDAMDVQAKAIQALLGEPNNIVIDY